MQKITISLHPSLPSVYLSSAQNFDEKKPFSLHLSLPSTYVYHSTASENLMNLEKTWIRPSQHESPCTIGP